MRVALILLLLSGPGMAQRVRRGPQQPTATSGAYNLPAVTFNGVLKEITAKSIVIESGDGQPVTIFRNHKTRFLRNNSVVDPKKLEAGTKLSIDVTKNPDASLLAVNVIALADSAQ